MRERVKCIAGMWDVKNAIISRGSKLEFFCRITIVIPNRKAQKTEVIQSRFEQTEYLFVNVE